MRKKAILITTLLLAACGSTPVSSKPLDWSTYLARLCMDGPTGVEPLDVKAVDGITAFNTGYRSEMQNCLVVTGVDKTTAPVTIQPYLKRTMFSVRITDIKAGDILSYVNEGEVTNDSPILVMIAAQADLGTSPNEADTIEPLMHGSGYNFDNKMHHATTPFVGNAGYVFKQDYPSVYLNIIEYAASSSSDGTVLLEVDQGYGALSGTITRP